MIDFHDMKRILIYLILSLAAAGALLTSCSDDSPTVNLGIDDVYYVSRMKKLRLESALTGSAYRWTLVYPDGTTEEVGDGPSYIFMQPEEGTYTVRFEIIDGATPLIYDFTVVVTHEEVEYSPWISKVYEYCPAPGQFVNTMPEYEDGDTYADMVRKAGECISGKNDVLISLGGYGGYVTFGFDHTVANVKGQKDFRLRGNAVYQGGNADLRAGSAEPGVVMVSYDTNMNGLPDDEWYELAGSEYYKADTRHKYTTTYIRPDPAKEPVTDPRKPLMTDLTYISWIDSDGTTGYIPKITYHTQDYYPKWVEEESLTFIGTCMPSNVTDLSTEGSKLFLLRCFDWGYADNHPNDCDDLNSFDISWAVDADGNPVDLPGADFVRVYTGLNQVCDWLGETSTEICRGQDLHISAE